MEIIETLTKTLSLKPKQIQSVLDLTQEGSTIPFIARYRKEMTGSLDEVQIKAIVDQHASLIKLAERQTTVLEKIDQLGKLTEQLKAEILATTKLAELEELYLPYKEKRQTKAMIAREHGLFDLAKLVMLGVSDLVTRAQDFVDEVFDTSEKALQGAQDILSEAISEDSKMRSYVNHEIQANSSLVSQVKDASLDDKKTFQIYYDFEERLSAKPNYDGAKGNPQPRLLANLPNYRVLALNRGEKLGILKVKFVHNEDKMLRFIENRYQAKGKPQLQASIKDALKKKLLPSMERQIRSLLTERAEDAAIEVFGHNLRSLLLVAPLKGKVVLGFDPAFRTGAKLAVVDATGKLLTTQVIYPVKPASPSQIDKAKSDLLDLIARYQVQMIAIGNGTASRESEQFIADVIKTANLSLNYVIVNESGASIYSASELARQEFPDLPVEKRSAISIARRLQDPLAELVKIEPQNIGIGQYQHDVSNKKLAENLDFVVETVVNQVGVNVNTASTALLAHVSGLNAKIAQNIVDYRERVGVIRTRTEIKQVPRLGAKSFEQAAGFLRIPESPVFLDNTGVHPESYQVVDQLLAKLGVRDMTEEARSKLKRVDVKAMSQTLSVGQETLTDIIADLLKPGRDLRDDFAQPLLRQDVLSIKDLTIGQKLEGVVRNVVDFGAFVDIGIKEDGLIHISEMTNKKFIRHPNEMLSVGDIVTVWVSKIDETRGKTNLSLIDPEARG